MEKIFKSKSGLYFWYMSVYFFFYWIGDWFFVVIMALAQIVAFLNYLIIIKEQKMIKFISNFQPKTPQEEYNRLVDGYNSFEFKPKTDKVCDELRHIKNEIEIILLQYPEIVQKPLKTFNV
jgi:hypothetical protein